MKVPIVVSIGEILWDIYPDKKRMGGAPFNFIYHIWKILGKANFISSVGNDTLGMEIKQYLTAIGFDHQHIKIDNAHPTGFVNVRIDENKNPVFTISAESSYDYITLNESTEQIIIESDLIYFGTLSQRNHVTRNTINSLFQYKKKFFCDLNLRHDFFTKELIETALYESHVLKLNAHELKILKTILILDEDSNRAIEQLNHKFNIELICVTMGENGALLYNGNIFDHYKATNVKIVDTLGAGDAYAAILCIGYLLNKPISEINKLANEFAGEICGICGALPKDDSVYNKYKNQLNI